MADELKPFACTYQFDGRLIAITVEARSWDEVSARLRAIGMTAVVNGELVTEVSAGIIGVGLGRALASVKSLSGGRGR